MWARRIAFNGIVTADGGGHHHLALLERRRHHQPFLEHIYESALKRGCVQRSISTAASLSVLPDFRQNNRTIQAREAQQQQSWVSLSRRVKSDRPTPQGPSSSSSSSSISLPLRYFSSLFMGFNIIAHVVTLFSQHPSLVLIINRSTAYNELLIE